MTQFSALHSFYLQTLFQDQITQRIPKQLDAAAVSQGISNYLSAEFEDHAKTHNIIWESGSTKLYHLGGDGMPILCVPSLINRYYIFDISEKRSMAQFFLSKGYSVYILDWDSPSSDELEFNISRYVLERLVPAMAKIHSLYSSAVHLVGYCMGGLISLAATQHKPELVASLTLIATPWDFKKTNIQSFNAFPQYNDYMENLFSSFSLVPGSFIHSLLFLADREATYRKYAYFNELTSTDPNYQSFLEREHWLHHPVPITSKVSKEIMLGWATENQPFAGKWKVGNQIINLQNIDCPTLVVAAQKDALVPASSSAPLLNNIEGGKNISPNTGHLGMVAGLKASRELWIPLANWLNSL